jgi:hypothetical protein
MAIWEDLESLQLRFPFTHAWGQAGTFEGGNVTSDASQLA